MALEPGSSLKKPILKPMSVGAYSRSWQDSLEIIRVIKTASGALLKVTLNHPLLLESGVLIEARDLQIGDHLIKVSGVLDPVVSIQDSEYFGRVYNIAPNSTDPTENIIVAEGFLIGSAGYQYTEELHKLLKCLNSSCK